MSWQDRLLEKKAVLEIGLTIAGLVVTVMLGIMAIGLTRAANRISASQLRLAERQTAVAEIELQPRFLFKLERTEGEYGSHDLLSIYNEGPPVQAFEIFHFEFLEIDKNGIDSMGRRVVPVYYFGDHESTGSAEGLLFTMSSIWSEDFAIYPPKNATQALGQIEVDLRESSRIQLARIRMFVGVYYVDMAGMEHDVYYEVNPEWFLHSSGLPRKLSPKLGSDARHLFRFSGPGAGPPWLLNLTASIVIENWEKYPESEELEETFDFTEHHELRPVDRFGGFRDP